MLGVFSNQLKLEYINYICIKTTYQLFKHITITLKKHTKRISVRMDNRLVPQSMNLPIDYCVNPKYLDL